MDDIHYYEVSLKWNSTRQGTLSSPVISSKIEVVTPPEFPKGIKEKWSPEHLFVSAVSSCLMTTFLAIAENSKLEFLSFDCEAIGKLEKVEGKLMISKVLLKPTVVIQNEKYIDKTIRILKKAENICLITQSIKSEINLEINVEVSTDTIEI